MSTTITTQCQACSATLQLPESAIGKRAKCPKCGSEFTVDRPTANVSQLPPPPPSPNAAQASVTQQPPPPPSQPIAPQTAPYAPPMPAIQTGSGSAKRRPSLSLMTIPLFISAGIYLLIGLGVGGLALYMLAATNDPEAWIVCIPLFAMALVSIALAGFIWYFTSELPRRKKWAWIAAIIMGAMYTPSAFFFLGIPILIGAFKSDVMEWYNRS